VVRPSRRREMARKAVEQRQISIRMACRLLGISETCYRYRAKLSDENAHIADWLLRLTTTHRTWGFGLFFLYQHLCESIAHAQDTATKWLWSYNNERPNMALGGITPIQKLTRAA